MGVKWVWVIVVGLVSILSVLGWWRTKANWRSVWSNLFLISLIWLPMVVFDVSRQASVAVFGAVAVVGVIMMLRSSYISASTKVAWGVGMFFLGMIGVFVVPLQMQRDAFYGKTIGNGGEIEVVSIAALNTGGAILRFKTPRGVIGEVMDTLLRVPPSRRGIIETHDRFRAERDDKGRWIFVWIGNDLEEGGRALGSLK